MAYKKTNTHGQEKPLTPKDLIAQGYSEERAYSHPGLRKQIEIADKSSGPEAITLTIADEDVPRVVMDGLRLTSAALRDGRATDRNGVVMTDAERAEAQNPDLTMTQRAERDAALAEEARQR